MTETGGGPHPRDSLMIDELRGQLEIAYSEISFAVPARDHARILYAYYDYEISLGEIYDPMFDF